MTNQPTRSTLPELIERLYQVAKELAALYPGRHFTPDGHTVGSIGECLAADAYGLELMPPSNRGYDATTLDGRKVEIKATQRNRVAFREHLDVSPDLVLVLKLNEQGTFEEVYNGPAGPIWECFKGRKLPSNGQYQIGVAQLRELGRSVANPDRIMRVD